MKEATSYILAKLLKLNSIKVDEKELEFQFESHPSYPSLHAITGVLKHFNIDNLALEVPKNVETLAELPNFFIAHIKNEKSEHFALAIKNKESIKLIYNKKNSESVSFDVFLEKWTGIVVAVEKTEEIKESGKFSRIQKITFASVPIMIVVLLFFINSPSLFQSLHFLLSLLGIGISVLIIQHELGSNSVILDKICGGNNKKISCNDVLNSKRSKVYRNIKLSDIGIVYFTSISLSWLLIMFMEVPNDTIIISFSILAIPFTLYSLYYQYFVVEKWCPLCLCIIAVLLAHAIFTIAFPVDFRGFRLDLYSNIAIIQSFISIITIWIILKSKLELKQELRKLKIKHYRFKKNFTIFESLISQNPIIDTTIINSSEIVFGNKEEKALLKIILVTNPLCVFCKEAHSAIVSILNSKNENVQISVRFNVNIKESEGVDTRIALGLLNIYHYEPEEVVMRAFHEIYYQMSPNEWLKKWRAYDSKLYFDELVKESEWCNNNNINFTPEILLNGISFPTEYERSDLKFFIEEIVEEELQKSKPLEEKK